MKQEFKTYYESPLMEIIEVQVEQGFANSNTTGNTNPFEESQGTW